MAGIEPFRFVPEGQSLQGAAFSRSFKAITLAVVAGSGLTLVNLLLDGKFGGASLPAGRIIVQFCETAGLQYRS